MARKLTTEEFVRRAVAIHGDKYGYGQCVYDGSKTKVAVQCKSHGVFYQNPSNHLRGFGCRMCFGESVSKRQLCTTEVFVKKAMAVHEDRYDYSTTDYCASDEPVAIRCHIHGIFNQVAACHLSGNGCPQCRNIYVGKTLSLSTEDFIARARNVHGDAYDYSNVEYINGKSSIQITCRSHGEFWQVAGSHLSGKGCTECGRKRIGESRSSNTSDFIQSATAVHGSRYDYSLADYKSSTTPIFIVCRKHGVFKQRPDGHLSGKGCRSCGCSRGETAVRKALEEARVGFVTEWTPGIPGYERCRFDFLIEDSLILEFDGVQHFEPRERFGGVKEFTNTVERDLIKTRWAYNNGYRLVRIPYTRKHEIVSIVNEAIEELGLCQLSI
jgi:hypothetical protein